MTDKRVSELTVGTATTTDDLLLFLDNPGGTPALKTITEANFLTSIAASATAAGVSELAIASEVNTGSDATRSITPDALAGSNLGMARMGAAVVAATDTVVTGDGKFYFPPIPASINGMNLVSVIISVFAKSTSGTPTVQVARGRQANATSAHTFADTLSTRVTIDANEYCSTSAATAAVIDTSNDDMATGDILRVDVDTAGTGTTGLFITMEFQLP